MQVGVSLKWGCSTELIQNACPFATLVTSQLKQFSSATVQPRKKQKEKKGLFPPLKCF